MARPRRGDKFAEESSSSSPRSSRRIRASLPRASKLNKPNYKVDGDDDDALMFEASNSSSSTRQRRHQYANNEKHRDIDQNLATKKISQDSIGTVLSWIFDMNSLEEFELIGHMDQSQRVLQTGFLVRKGVICCCCKKAFTLSEFGVHGGDERVTFQNIIIPSKNNASLFSCQIEAWNRLMANPGYSGYNNITNEQEPSDASDDSCVICGDGGNLICCSSCPSTYHQSCLNLLETPSDDWKCHYCRCKYCGDASEGRMLFTCTQCEKKYHLECFGGEDLMSFDLNVSSSHFCGSACSKIYAKLKEMLGVKMQIDKDLSWTFVKRIDKENIHYMDDLCNIVTSNSKVAVAAKIMEESFEPIVDRFTKVNMVRSVIFNCGSNFPRINFTGFYTAILESKEEIITVASVRIHGPKIAEIPFIATAQKWRCQGMCRALLTAIESALSTIGVEHLYMPSTRGMARKWKTRYGFENLRDDVGLEVINTNCLMFLSLTRLQKKIQGHNHKGLMFLPDLNMDPPED